MLDGTLAIILVLLGGAFGSIWRYAWSGFFAERLGETFPFGTLVVNLVGSMLIGLFSGLVARVSSGAVASLVFRRANNYTYAHAAFFRRFFGFVHPGEISSSR